MSPANCKKIGRWRIVEADIWDRAYLKLSGPATVPTIAIEVEFAYRNGDEAALKAKRDPSSTRC